MSGKTFDQTAFASSEQIRAVSHVREISRSRVKKAFNRIDLVLANAAIMESINDLLDGLRARGSITLNFHPDRLLHDGRSVVEALLEEGVYRNQFESQIYNGGLTAFPGGDRDSWERDLFGDTYHEEGVRNEDRPKYGGLNLMKYQDGACPRFGSCYLMLKPHALDFSTYSFGDSVTDPDDVGVIDTFYSVFAALLEDTEDSVVLGRRDVDIHTLVEHLRGRHVLSSDRMGRSLDNYIEAQIHMRLQLDRDVELLVADPSFRETKTGQQLATLSETIGAPIEWHKGSVLSFESIPSDFRETTTPLLGARITREFSSDGLLSAAVLGQAARSVVYEPERWADWADPVQTLQDIKYVWHSIVEFGQPFQPHG